LPVDQTQPSTLPSAPSGGHHRTRRRRLLVAIGIVFVAIAAFVLVWFQPQKLFIDDRVDESAPSVLLVSPTTTPGASSSPSPSTVDPAPTTTAGTTTVASGSFRSLEHTTIGQAIVLQLPDGRRVLRFENLDTSNGPDLRVILSSVPSTAGDKEFGKDYVELGKLKGNIGNQNYDIPPEVDLRRYSSAVVWCERFKVGFGVAGLA
jgi:Electron transfer DM13